MSSMYCGVRFENVAHSYDQIETTTLFEIGTKVDMLRDAGTGDGGVGGNAAEFGMSVYIKEGNEYGARGRRHLL